LSPFRFFRNLVKEIPRNLIKFFDSTGCWYLKIGKKITFLSSE
jgi:hypothetical protein